MDSGMHWYMPHSSSAYLSSLQSADCKQLLADTPHAGQYAQAHDKFERSLAIKENLYGHDNSMVSTSTQVTCRP